MLRRRREIASGTVDRIVIAIALGARHRQRIRRDEFIERCASAILSYESALRLSDLQQIHSHPGNADRLRRSRTRGCHRHLFEIEVVHAEDKRRSYQNSEQPTHSFIVLLRTYLRQADFG